MMLFLVSIVAILSTIGADETAKEEVASYNWLPEPFDKLSVSANGCPLDWSVHLLLPHEHDCTKFYTCDRGVRVLTDCAPGTAFDYPIQVCNWPDAVECTSLPGSVYDNADKTDTDDQDDADKVETVIDWCKNCTLTTEYYPYDCDCKYFFRCYEGLAVLAACPDGLYFNSERRICDFPENVSCKSS